VFQLAHVAGPVVQHQLVQSLCREANDFLLFFLRIPGDKVPRQQRNVFAPLAQRRQCKRNNIQSIEKILTHFSVADCFFEIETLQNFPQAYNVGQPIFRGVYEDNDPGKRLQMIVNYNTDISQFWEWSGRGFRPFDDTNEAYKLGVNYLIYGLTH